MDIETSKLTFFRIVISKYKASKGYLRNFSVRAYTVKKGDFFTDLIEKIKPLDRPEDKENQTRIQLVAKNEESSKSKILKGDISPLDIYKLIENDNDYKVVANVFYVYVHNLESRDSDTKVFRLFSSENDVEKVFDRFKELVRPRITNNILGDYSWTDNEKHKRITHRIQVVKKLSKNTSTSRSFGVYLPNFSSQEVMEIIKGEDLN